MKNANKKYNQHIIYYMSCETILPIKYICQFYIFTKTKLFPVRKVDKDSR